MSQTHGRLLSQIYHFGDFTLENYSRLIQLAKDNDFIFSAFSDQFSIEKKHLIWRHDVEFSPFIAFEMAKIEAMAGVKSTYFFQLHSEFYNCLEKAILEIVIEISKLGHQIGLHFDSHFYNIDKEIDLEKFLLLDSSYFNSVMNLKVETFSFHNTNKFILGCKNYKYADLINVYSDFFRENFSYCTDSTGFWRYERLEEVISNRNTKWLHVLVHDAMWSEIELPPRQRVFTSIDKNAERQKKYYDDALLKFNAKNVDWDSDF